MTELIIFFSVAWLALLGYHAWYVRETTKAHDKLINALVAKSARELQDLEYTAKLAPTTQTVKEPQMVAEADLPDDEFDKILKQEIG